VLDLETTSLTALESEIVGLAFAFEAHEAWYLPANLATPIFGPGERGLTARERFGTDGRAGRLDVREPRRASGRARRDAACRRPAAPRRRQRPGALPRRPAARLCRPAVAVIGQNLKYDLLALGRYGLSPPNVAFDTMLASFCLDAHQSQHGLDFLSLKHLGITKIPTSALIGKGAKQICMWDAPVASAASTPARTPTRPSGSTSASPASSTGSEVEHVFREIEMPLLRVLEDMERQGSWSTRPTCARCRPRWAAASRR
jgi:DNA polymerase I-like protein with 3'-5' exonuclease and polymerase domains